MAKFSAVHYNAIAKEIRDVFPQGDGFETRSQRNNYMAQRAVLAALALNFAQRFNQDNPRFNPLKFLDACSPDVDVYPLSEFWEDYSD
jgi:hypothetical protein